MDIFRTTKGNYIATIHIKMDDGMVTVAKAESEDRLEAMRACINEFKVFMGNESLDFSTVTIY